MPRITAVLLLGLLSLAGCSGGGDDDDGVATLGDGERSETPERGVDTEVALLDFSQCMRSEGIDGFPDLDEDSTILDVPGAGIDPFTPEFEAALDQCDSHLEGVVFDTELDPEQVAEIEDTALEIVQCMRDRGYDIPEPQGVPDAEYFASLADAGIDVNDPQLLADARECFSASGFGGRGGDEADGGG